MAKSKRSPGEAWLPCTVLTPLYTGFAGVGKVTVTTALASGTVLE
jgi:hypothetical protein